jgi:RNA polymerase sigma factor (sigma-70 family)
VIAQLSSADAPARALAYEKVVAAYWKPAYKHVRLKWRASNDDAKDIVQGFFTRALDKSFLQDFDPSRATFRVYLRVCLDRFAANERQRAAREKRGGGMAMAALDPEELESGEENMDDRFHREWMRSLFEQALATLRERCEAENRIMQFRIFERYDLCPGKQRPTYDQLARELGVTAGAVNNYLAAMRRDVRRTVLEKLREITSGEREFQREARTLFGISK